MPSPTWFWLVLTCWGHKCLQESIHNQPLNQRYDNLWSKERLAKDHSLYETLSFTSRRHWPIHRNSPGSKCPPHCKSDLSILLAWDLLKVLIPLMCFPTVLLCSLLHLNAETRTNPSKNLDWRLRVALLSVKVPFDLCGFMGVDDWTRRRLSGLQGGSVC